MKSRFRLVKSEPSDSTVEMLERLLAEARSGELIGMLVVAMYERREFGIGVTGEAYRNPIFSRGMLASLDDYLRDTLGDVG